MRAKNYLITHAHMDHASGIPYIISQKALIKAKPATFYMPEQIVEPLDNIIKTWGRIEGHEYGYSFYPIKEIKEFKLDENYSFKPFETFHRVPSYGYTILENRKKLKAEFLGKKEKEIVELKKQGVEISEPISLRLFSYTGDSKIEFWDKNPEVLKSKILFMEVTYWDDKKSIQSAREWGHIHLDEVLDRLDEFKGEKLVFTHISSRYSLEYVRQILKKRVPAKYQDIVDIFPCL